MNHRGRDRLQHLGGVPGISRIQSTCSQKSKPTAISTWISIAQYPNKPSRHFRDRNVNDTLWNTNPAKQKQTQTYQWGHLCVCGQVQSVITSKYSGNRVAGCYPPEISLGKTLFLEIQDRRLVWLDCAILFKKNSIIHPSIHSHPSFHSSIQLWSVHPSIYTSFIHSYVNASVHQSIDTSIHLSIH